MKGPEDKLFVLFSLVARGKWAIVVRRTAPTFYSDDAVCSSSPQAAQSKCHVNTRPFSWFGGLVAEALTLAAAILLPSDTRGANLILNGGFESGSAAWGLQEASVTSAGGYAHSGTSYLEIFPEPWMGHQGYGYQTISIPANVTAATLSFYWNVSMLYPNAVASDILTVLVRDPAYYGVLENLAYISSANKSAPGNPNYHLAMYDLRRYAGSSVRIDFLTYNNPVSGETVFRIDDVSVTTSTSPCTCSLSPTNDNPSTPGPGSGSFSVFSSNSACLWVASGSSWIHTSNRGLGNGTVNYTYDANSTALPRTGFINVLDRRFTITQPGLLAAPDSLTPTNGATGLPTTPTLTWSPVIGATRYRVMLSTNSANLPLAAYAATCTNCPSTGLVGSTDLTNYTTPSAFPLGGSTRVLKRGTRYYWKVQAWNDNGFAGAYSSVSSFTTAPVARPAMAAPKLEDSSFTVTIPTELGVDYFLERKQSLSDPTWVAVQGGNGSGNGDDITLSDLSATGTSRMYRVRAKEAP